MLIASPSLLNQFLLQKDVKNMMATVRLVLTTGSKLSAHLKRSFFERTNKHIINYYGLTETTGFCIGESSDTHNFNGNSIGNPVDCIVQVVDENRNKVNAGDVGELRIYAYCISKGYWNAGNATDIHKHDWFYTGDLAKVDAAGGIELIGRKTAFIKTARSEIVFLREIEEAIEKLPFIADMYVTSYFQDEAEKIALFLEIKGNMRGKANIVEQVIEVITAKMGADKIPSQIRVISAIPRNENGKVLRNDLEKYL
jgi:acyl-coenzyme A synthetase/AMP-(fatty) acid ligase